jgi:hypothetical protein
MVEVFMRARGNPFLKSLSLLLVFVLSVPFSVLAETAKAEPPQTSITFKEPSYVVPGKRITLNAEVRDPAGIKLVRCYFRAAGEADYVFVTMSKQSESTYIATLPAPSATSKALEYMVLSVNTYNSVVRTKQATVAINTDPAIPTPDTQQNAEQGTINISTELAKAPQTVSGFADNITVDVVESSSRFMLVSGVGVATGMAVSSGSAAVAAGTVGTTTAAAATAGTTTIMGVSATTFGFIAAGVAAVAVGAAVAASSGGGGKSGGSPSTAKAGSFTAHW